jgi:pyroglutamyl-peptidase
MKTVLVTGFEPFDGETSNPSAEIARALDGRVIARRRVIGRTLPCRFGASRRELLRLIREHDPEVVMAVGQAGGRAEITPERVAINVDDARIPDNGGAQPIDVPILRGGPAAYWSSLPIKAMVAALRAEGISAAVSQTAGTFVCNHVFYGLMHALRRRPRTRGGFVHVPYTREQAARHPGAPGLPLEQMVEALAVALAAAITVRRDRRLSGGATA